MFKRFASMNPSVMGKWLWILKMSKIKSADK